jgi:hypothetical protein
MPSWLMPYTIHIEAATAGCPVHRFAATKRGDLAAITVNEGGVVLFMASVSLAHWMCSVASCGSDKDYLKPEDEI